MRRSLRTDDPNNVGVRRQVPPKASGLGQGRPVPFLQVRADDDDARGLNLVLLPGVLSDTAAPHGPCVAMLEWGTGGAAVSAEVDVAKGTQVQISASYVAIAVRNDGGVDDGTGTSVDPQPGSQEVIVMVAGYGGRVAFGKATRTFYFRGIPPTVDGAVLVTVPNFAKSVLVTRTPPATTGVTVELVDNVPFPTGDPQFTPGGNVRAAFNFPGGTLPPSIDLNALTSFVRVRNSGEVTISFLQIAFELAL
jgi:hypothetical protein